MVAAVVPAVGHGALVPGVGEGALMPSAAVIAAAVVPAAGESQVSVKCLTLESACGRGASYGGQSVRSRRHRPRRWTCGP